jgi:4-alpha-glucanotransferase
MVGDRGGFAMSRKLVYDEYEDSSGEIRRPPASVIETLEKRLGATVLPTATARSLRALKPEKRSSGLALQLYALRHEGDWGMGDFAGLAKVCKWGAEQGLTYIGVNPLHALKTALPAAGSPYYPVSRFALHPLYISIDWLADELSVPVSLHDDAASALRRARGADLIDYDAVSTAKIAALREIYAAAPLPAEAEAFLSSPSDGIRAHAIWEAFCHAGSGPASQDILTGAEAVPESMTEEVRFHLFLQWAADRQLMAASTAGGKRTSLYLDLAVGAAPDGSEVQGKPNAYVEGVRLGAPPDLMGPQGQDWGITPLHPVNLARGEGKAFGDMLAASAAYAGALRIDHALGLERQFFIPEDAQAKEATYVAFPRDLLFDTIAEVSAGHDCVMIGEALGTVPPGLVAAMHSQSIFSYEVTRWARDEEDEFLDADDYPELCLAAATTHDIAPIAGWLNGKDLEARLGAGQITQKEQASEEKTRAEEKAGLLALWDVDEAAPAKDVVLAAHAFLKRSKAMIAMMTLEDLLLQEDMMNLPGTTDEHPNWKRRYAKMFDDWSVDEAVLARLEAGLR